MLWFRISVILVGNRVEGFWHLTFCCYTTRKGEKESQCLYENLGEINPHVLFTDFVPSLGSREENGFFFFSFLQVPTGSPNPGQSTRWVFLVLLELGIILITKIFMNDTTNSPPSNHIPGKSTNILKYSLPLGRLPFRVDGCLFLCAEAFLFDIPLLFSW